MIGDELGEKVVSVQFRAGEKLTGAILKKLFHVSYYFSIFVAKSLTIIGLVLLLARFQQIFS